MSSISIFQTRTYKILILILGLLLLVYLYKYNAPKDKVDNVYESQRFDHAPFSHIHFADRSNNVGVNYTHHVFSTGRKNKEDLELLVEPIAPSTSVVDINHDGFMDIYITTGKGSPNLLYINHHGLYFSEEAKKYGLANLNQEYDPSYAFWGDFNGDGMIDLVLARYGCHSLFLGQKDNTFKERKEWFNGYCSKPNGVNGADFYNHGKLDLIFANFLPGQHEDWANVLWMANTRYDNQTGGENHLLKNMGSSFKVETKANFITKSYSHNAGVADINLDGLNDIFFANDYAHDEMFLNKGNGVFEDVTNTYIPKVVHGLAGMNTEFFDYDNDGLIDLYVTNIYKPPFNRHFNLLWKKKDDNTFENVSNKLGVAKCGFSWGAKFADIDNDGEVDLLVMNGRSRAAEVTSPELGKSMWFERNEVSQIPTFLKDLYRPKKTLKGRFISAFERKCLFIQKNGRFYDVAPMAGFDDREENRGIALVDYDNDGKMDVITSGPMAKLKLMHNESVISHDNSWIGFSLKDSLGNTIPHGARVVLKINDHSILRELYPANGYKGFNDSRVHIGLGKVTKLSYVDVFWPVSKKTKRYRKIEINQYNEINENDSDEVLP